MILLSTPYLIPSGFLIDPFGRVLTVKGPFANPFVELDFGFMLLHATDPTTDDSDYTD